MQRAKRYNDYLEEFKKNILQWVDWYGMSFKDAFEGIIDYIKLVPIDYRDDLKEDLKIWSLENERVM